uniref:Rhodanese domain-containing protein n=1 Tax=Moniliophthora roreri TaxID=221103 RepID=A0A0W0FQJ8_MONRR
MPSQSTSSASTTSASSSSSSITSYGNPLDPQLQPLPLRTLSSVREQVAEEIAMRTTRKAQRLDGILDVEIGVTLTFSSKESSERDLSFLSHIASVIDRLLPTNQYLFIIATTGRPPPDSTSNFMLICASDDDYIQRAMMLISAKFVDRVTATRPGSLEKQFIAEVKDVGLSSYDELALWDVIKKSARAPIDPLLPPPGSRSAERMLSDVRAQLQRLSPLEAFRELRDPTDGTDGVFAPTYLVDIRSQVEREAEGGIAGALVVERGQLEWKLDPRSSEKLTIVDRYDLRLIVFCTDGRASSLAAGQLKDLGMWNATDIVGGFRAWKESKFPVFNVGAGRISRPLMVDLDAALEVINDHLNGPLNGPATHL